MRFLIFALFGQIYIKQETILDVFFVYCEIHIDSKKNNNKTKQKTTKEINCVFILFFREKYFKLQYLIIIFKVSKMF